MSLVNASVRTGNWRTALIMLEELRKANTPPRAATSDSSAPAPTFAYDMEILSRIGRVFLQVTNYSTHTVCVSRGFLIGFVMNVSATFTFYILHLAAFPPL